MIMMADFVGWSIAGSKMDQWIKGLQLWILRARLNRIKPLPRVKDQWLDKVLGQQQGSPTSGVVRRQGFL